MKKQILTIIASLLLFTSVNAIEIPSMTFGIGVSGGMAQVNASGSESESANTGAEASVRSISVDAMSPIGSIFAEIILDNGMTFGYEIVPMSADVTDSAFSRTETSEDTTGGGTTGSNKRTADAEVENFQTFYTEIPIGAMYVKAGISQIDINTLENKIALGGSYKNDTVDGYTFGIGLKGEWAGFYTKIALERSDFDDYVASSGTTNTIRANLDVNQVKFSLGKAF